MRLKYRTRIGGTLYEIGTEVFPLDPTDPKILEIFPEICENPESAQVAVSLADRPGFTILHVSQIEELCGRVQRKSEGRAKGTH